jgi:hypothetical protein
MSYAQSAVVESESWLRALLLRGGFDLDEWREQRRAGRYRSARRLVVAACLYPLIMTAIQAVVLLAANLPLSLMTTRAYVAWAVPVMIAFPLIVWWIARLAWDVREEQYRREKSRRGQMPTPLINERVRR